MSIQAFFFHLMTFQKCQFSRNMCIIFKISIKANQFLSIPESILSICGASQRPYSFINTKMDCRFESALRIDAIWCATLTSKKLFKFWSFLSKKWAKTARNGPKIDPAHSCASMRPSATKRALNFGPLGPSFGHRGSQRHPVEVIL